MPYKDPQKRRECEARYRERNREVIRDRGLVAYYKAKEEGRWRNSKKRRPPFYPILVAQQNNCCAICREPETMLNRHKTQIRSLNLDHDHNTGEIRGLLCTSCNLMIGNAKDRIDILEKAIEYLGRAKFTGYMVRKNSRK